MTNGIFKLVNGIQTELVDFSPIITPDTNYNIKIERSGTTIKVYRDNTLIGTTTDTSFTGGKVGFGTRNDSASFDNLIVTLTS